MTQFIEEAFIPVIRQTYRGFLVGGSALLLLLAAACSGTPLAQADPTPTLIPRDVGAIKPTYEVQTGDITQKSQFTGRIVPVMDEQLSFRVDGHVKDVLVSEGDSVTAGQVLAELDVIDDMNRQQTLNDLAVQRAQLRLDQARLQRQLAAAQADPETRDVEDGIREIDVQLAQLDLDELQLQLAGQQSNLEDAQIIAPFDGEILSLNIVVGQGIDALDPAMVLADMTALEVSADLQRARVDELEVGMPAVIEHVNQPGDTVSGQIRRLPFGADSGDTSVRISLESTPEASGFNLNDRVQITVTLQQVTDVLWLPPQAIRTFGGRQFVVVQDGDAQRRVDVTLGLMTSDRVEITDGLSAGQIVVGP